MNTRAKILSALASAGILAAGWQAGMGHEVDSITAAIETSPTTKASVATQATTTADTGTFTGSTASHRYSSVTVTVTLDKGRITALSERVVSDGERHSDQINQRAIPYLKQALIGTDGTSVSTISGATYTSEAYLTSLQSVLDKAT